MLLEPISPRSELGSIDASSLALSMAQGTAIGSLLAFWNDNADGDAIPRKSDFLPEHHAAVLGFINILEVSGDPPDFVFRLMGSRIASALGSDLTSQSIARVRPIELSRLLHEHLMEAIQLNGPTLYRMTARRDERVVHYLRIILPLSQSGERVNYLMTGSVCGGQVNRRAECLL